MRRQHRTLEILSPDDVEAIHRTSLAILEEVGVRFPNEEMLGLFENGGARVDHDRQVVRIPAELVEKAIQTLPKDFTVTPGDSGEPVRFGDGKLKLCMDTTPDIVDYMTNTKRRGGISDALKGIVVGNALESVRTVSAYCLPSDVPEQAADIVAYQLLYTYSKKPVSTWIYSSPSADYVIEMAKVVAGGEAELRRRKNLTYFAEPISPLQYAPHTLEIVLKLAKYALPIYLGPMVTAGGSGPVTLAGTTALQNAEVLQGLVMIYLCNPDQPVIYSNLSHTLDLRTGVIQYGAPEQALLAISGTQMARRYGLAACGNVNLSDSNLPDYMYGFQAGATAAYALAAGWEMLGFSMFGSIGVVGNGVGLSLEQTLLTDEALNYLSRMVKGIEVSEDTLALDMIKRVGIGGNFLSEEHTARHMRDELWRGSGIFDLIGYEAWSKNPESCLDRAHRKLASILKAGSPPQPVLGEAKARQIREIADEAIRRASE